ncbi:MAG: hypothetical protein JEZ12_15955 [Desulfobacterium sp.]|nr:hypothetical protein [Desulfobacterium sp.]
MSPDAKEGSRQSGYGPNASSNRGIRDKGGWEHAVADKSKGLLGYRGSGGYTVGGTGVNTGKVSLGDIHGYGPIDASKIGFQVAKDNPGKAIGSLGGLAFGGIPGLSLGYRAGDLVDKAMDGWGVKSLANDTVGLGLDAFGNPAVAAGYDIASGLIDSDAKLSTHVGTMAGAGLGGHKLGGVLGMIVGAKLGQAIGNAVPAGDMNPTNSDPSSGVNDSSSSLDGGGGGDSLASTDTGMRTTALVGPEGSSVGPHQMMVDRFKNVQARKQWNDFQKRFHAA